MKERPILFSGPMVRAILEGRKTQTRRVVKCRGLWTCECPDSDEPWPYFENELGEWEFFECPHGCLGDRLWVRESFCQKFEDGRPVYNADGNLDCTCCYYRADGVDVRLCDGDGFSVFTKSGLEASPWRPSIHMPRWASRITLEITDVRVERLHEASDADCRAEGCCHRGWNVTDWKHPHNECGWSIERANFASLWSSINARPNLPVNTNSKRYHRVKKWLDKHPDTSWSANPWVWVIEFRRADNG